jgi:hypothetical protein
LIRIDRSKLLLNQKSLLTELVIDSLGSSGDRDSLRQWQWLTKLPTVDCTPRVWRTLESIAMSRLSRHAMAREIEPALDLWDVLIRRAWPAGSEFPAWFTERLAAMVDSDTARNLTPYHERLLRAARSLTADGEQPPNATLVNDELKRVETSFGFRGKTP